MAFENDDVVNAGEVLRQILEELHPYDLDKSQSCINKIDSALAADGELSSLVYRSTVNYMLRRLVTAAAFIERKCLRDNLPFDSIEVEIKKYINNSLNIRNIVTVERITALLLQCLKLEKMSANPSVIKTVKERAKERNELLCYLCGRELKFETKEQDDSAEVEHRFPKSMGGSSRSDINLKYACKKCNKIKKSHIDDSDYHYEKICFVTDEGEESFKAEFEYVYKLAVWSKNRNECQFCRQPASKVGKLHFVRRNLEDNWHYLNIEAYCTTHYLMIKKRQGSL